MKFNQKIYSDSEMKLIKEIFDMQIKRIYDEDLKEIINEYKELFVDNQKILKENKQLHYIMKEIRKKIDNLGTYKLMNTKYISKSEVMKILDKENNYE